MELTFLKTMEIDSILKIMPLLAHLLQKEQENEQF